MGFSQVCKYRLILERKQNRDETTLKIELKEANADRNKLSNELNQKFQDTCRVKIDRLEFVDTGSIPEKQQGIVDSRKYE